jgi:hypothetical protein
MHKNLEPSEQIE